MVDSPLVWHYGLMAERWSEFNNEAREVPWFLEKIKQYGQPVLDLACGAGRVFLPILREGLDIDGSDISKDMLRYCRMKAEQTEYNPGLYPQSMHELDIPRKYGLIFICDSFGLSGSRENDLEALKSCHTHLEEGGALIVNIQADYTDPDWWGLWLSENRNSLPEPWPEKSTAKIASDGSQHFSQFRLVELDPFEQSYLREVRLEKWMDGKLVASEEYQLRGNIYFKQELLLMLKMAGFNQISVYGDYTDQPATADSEEIVFVAVK